MKRWLRLETVLLLVFALVPLGDTLLERLGLREWTIGNEVCQKVFVFAILGLGLNVVVGYTGLLHLGAAAFMAIGVYTFAIATSTVYPFQLGFWLAAMLAVGASALAGVLLGTPTLRLRGDYLAIVTLGFGEMTQDVLKNLVVVTKGAEGITALPPPHLFAYRFTSLNYVPWYYLYLAAVAVVALLVRNLEYSRLGRQWMAMREDQLAASCMGVNPASAKVLAFAVGAAICGFAGVLWASKLANTDPFTYDFAISITVLCLLIVGGMGSIRGVLAGACVVMGFEIVLAKFTAALQRAGVESGSNVFLTPNNWKFLLFGLALVVMMQWRHEGIFPSTRVKEELHEAPTPAEQG